MKTIAFILCLLGGVALADQITVLVRKEISVTTDEDTGAVNTNETYVFSAPMSAPKLGQLQASVIVAGGTASSTVSNMIAARTQELLQAVWHDSDIITVLMPP